MKCVPVEGSCTWARIDHAGIRSFPNKIIEIEQKFASLKEMTLQFIEWLTKNETPAGWDFEVERVL